MASGRSRALLTWVAIVLLIVVGLATGCGSDEGESGGKLPASSMKGYELYSWKSGGEWRFAVLVGTNRNKSLEEITSPATVLEGVDECLDELARINGGQSVFWGGFDGLGFPPEDIVMKVEDFCRRAGLELSITK